MRDELDACWQQLNPVFVRGMQRSGTSVMARALQEMGILGFGEGHLWFELVEPLRNILDPSYYSILRDHSYTLGAGRERQLVKYVALCLDQFHRDHLPTELSRWMDKSPGALPVRVAPMLAELFPQSQFIFLYRNGITTVHSGVRFWNDDPDAFESLCRGWTETMSTWRNVRGALRGRYIEIAQEELAAEPFSATRRLTDFLDRPDALMEVYQVFANKRVLPAFPDKQPGDYAYKLDWNREQTAQFESMCGKEMEIWGYELDFEESGVTRADLAASEDLEPVSAILEQRNARIADLEGECIALRDRLREVERGRVMRLMTGIQRRVRGLQGSLRGDL